MKKYLLLFLALFLAAVPMMAQKRSHEDMRKEILEFKLKYIAQEIELQENQKKQFVDLYTKMENERHNIYSEAHQIRERVKSNNATDEDYKKAATLDSEIKKKDAEIQEKYIPEFEKFLSAKQIYKMKEAEESFRNKMKEMRKAKKKK